MISSTAEVRSTPHERCRAYPCNDRAKGTSRCTDWFDHSFLLAFAGRIGVDFRCQVEHDDEAGDLKF